MGTTKFREPMLLPEGLRAFERVLNRRHLFTKRVDDSLVVYEIITDDAVRTRIKFFTMFVGDPNYQRTKVRRLQIICDSELIDSEFIFPNRTKIWDKTYDLKYGHPKYRQISARIMHKIRKVTDKAVIQHVIAL